MARECIFVGELSDFCVGTSFVLTTFLWMFYVVTRLVFNNCVVREGLVTVGFSHYEGKNCSESAFSWLGLV